MVRPRQRANSMAGRHQGPFGRGFGCLTDGWRLTWLKVLDFRTWAKLFTGSVDNLVDNPFVAFPRRRGCYGFVGLIKICAELKKKVKTGI